MAVMMENIKIKGESTQAAEFSKSINKVLTPEAKKFLAALHERFNARREELLASGRTAEDHQQRCSAEFSA